MKLYSLKKILLITLLTFASSAQLQAMSLKELMLIMFICSPGIKTAIQVAKDQYIPKTRCIIQGNYITWERLAMLPDDALIIQYPSLKLSADIRNKNRFGTEYPATDGFDDLKNRKGKKQ